MCEHCITQNKSDETKASSLLLCIVAPQPLPYANTSSSP